MGAQPEAGRTVAVLVEEDNRIVGYAGIYRNQVMWSRRVSEIWLNRSEP